jgi:predicted kinase
MLIGLPGCGKSTLANKFKEASHTVVLSSDSIREELFGNEDEQMEPERVFATMFYRTIQALENNLDVIYDATNINRKLRINTLDRLKKAVSRPFITEAVVIYTDIAEVKRRNASRDRVVPEYVIDNMLKNFELPTYNEGWNFIGVHYSTDPNLNWLDAVEYYAKDLTHENPWHNMNVDEHMRAALYYFNTHYNPNDYPDYLEKAILLHDIGKRFCKTFVNRKGQTTEVAHYYQHANPGAYFALGIKFDLSEEDKYKVALLINYHMRPLEAWKDSKKAEEKDRRLLGDELYSYIRVLHTCDEMSEQDEDFVKEFLERSKER